MNTFGKKHLKILWPLSKNIANSFFFLFVPLSVLIHSVCVSIKRLVFIWKYKNVPMKQDNNRWFMKCKLLKHRLDLETAVYNDFHIQMFVLLPKDFGASSCLAFLHSIFYSKFLLYICLVNSLKNQYVFIPCIALVFVV